MADKPDKKDNDPGDYKAQYKGPGGLLRLAKRVLEDNLGSLPKATERNVPGGTVSSVVDHAVRGGDERQSGYDRKKDN